MSAPRRALVVVDAQMEYVDGPLQIQYPPREQSLANITTAMKTAEQHDVPVVVVQHSMAPGSPVFDPGSPGWQLHPDVAALVSEDTKRIEKRYGSVFAGTDLTDWLAQHRLDTVTLVGFMTNNCDLASAVEAEGLGVTAEILSDATGAINIANDAGSATAEQVHTTLMTLFHSNFAAVATTDAWAQALADGTALPKSNLVESALQGREAAG